MHGPFVLLITQACQSPLRFELQPALPTKMFFRVASQATRSTLARPIARQIPKMARNTRSSFWSNSAIYSSIYKRTFIVFRFIAGSFGAGPMNIGGGSIADQVEMSRRGFVMSIFFTGYFLGPVIG